MKSFYYIQIVYQAIFIYISNSRGSILKIAEIQDDQEMMKKYTLSLTRFEPL